MIEVDGITKVFALSRWCGCACLEARKPFDPAERIRLDRRALGMREIDVTPSDCGVDPTLHGDGRRSTATEVDAPRRDIGIVFQAPTLLPWANVLANLLFPLKVLRRLDGDSKARAYDLLKLVGLVTLQEDAVRAFGRHAAAGGDLPGADPRSRRSFSWTSRSARSTR